MIMSETCTNSNGVGKNIIRGKPVGSHCKIGSLPSGTALVPYPGRSVANLACAHGVIGGISFSGAVLSAPPLPWYNQTPDRSRLGAGPRFILAVFLLAGLRGNTGRECQHRC